MIQQAFDQWGHIAFLDPVLADWLEEQGDYLLAEVVRAEQSWVIGHSARPDGGDYISGLRRATGCGGGDGSGDGGSKDCTDGDGAGLGDGRGRGDGCGNGDGFSDGGRGDDGNGVVDGVGYGGGFSSGAGDGDGTDDGEDMVYRINDYYLPNNPYSLDGYGD
jgi:hypothetical protein